MTPEREEYLAKCSKRELILRHWINVDKGNISRYKFGLNYDKTFTDDDIEYCLGSIRFHKDRINCYRHELQRLKGMDRVVVVGDDEPSVNTLTGAEHWTCKCGTGIYETDNYCSGCGRRVLRR